MPQTYHVKLSDGREFNVTTEGGPPSEADVLGSLEQKPAASARPVSPDEPGTWWGGVAKSVKEGLTPNKIGHALTATLPVAGGVFGGMAGSAGMPIVGTAVGAGAGTYGGEAARQIANHYLFGDPMNPYAPTVQGLLAGTGGAVMEAAPAAVEALRPSNLLGDVERTGTISPGRVGAQVLKRFAGSLRTAGGPKPVLTRPLWQAQEGQLPAEATPFNELSLAQQMEQLPTTGGVGTLRTSNPPMIPQKPFNEQPLYQQMNQLMDVGPMPESTRWPEPPIQNLGRETTGTRTTAAAPETPAGVLHTQPTPAAETASAGFTPTERADLLRQQVSPQSIAKAEARMGNQPAAPAPPAGGAVPPPPVLDPEAQAIRDQTATPAPAAEESPLMQQLRDSLAAREAPTASPEPVTPPDIESQEGRFLRGAEKQAQAEGKTIEQTRHETDSVQGTRDETSESIPWDDQQRMMEKMDRLRKEDPSGRSLVKYIDDAPTAQHRRDMIQWERADAFRTGRQPLYGLAGALGGSIYLRKALLDQLQQPDQEQEQ